MHNTGNPIGSRDILDLYDNSENIDYFTNSQLDEHPDRFGVKRLTLAGLIRRSMTLRNEINDFSGALPLTPSWKEIPMNVSEGVGTALNLQAEALGGRSEMLRNQMLETLKRSYAEAGLTVKGYFVVGNTITSVTDVLIDPVTGKGYSYTGTYPHTVVDGETPVSTGWGDESGELLRVQFLLSNPISVLDEGAVADSTTGLNGTDSTAGFLSAIAKCKSTGKALLIPGGIGGYRLTQTVDMRHIFIIENAATLYINHPGIGVIFGGNASNPNNPKQHFGTIIRTAGIAGRLTPDMRGIGLKGQHIYVARCDFLQLYANDTLPNKATDYSCAYSTLTLKKVDTIEIYGEPGTYGWINENIFYLNRTNKILFVDGQYHHNHNKFYNGTMEGSGIIDLPIGSNNYFYGFRFERGGAAPDEFLNINFGLNTWNNSVETTWRSSPGYSNEPYNPLYTQVVVNDLGRGNAVYHGQDIMSDEVSIFSLTESTPFVSHANASMTGILSHNTDLHGVRYVQHLIDGRFKLKGNYAPLLMDDRKIPVRNGDMFAIYSDANLFRPFVYLYDMAGNLIRTEPTDPNMVYMPSKAWNPDGYYTIGANTGRTYILVGSGISAIRFQLNTGNSVIGETFKTLRITGRFYKNASPVNRKAFGFTPIARKSSMTYFNASDINMANIAEGLPCYKNDMTEMKVNLLRQLYLVKSVSGNVITVSGTAVQYFDLGSCNIAYTSADDNVMVPITTVSGQNITLANPVPSEIVAGSNIVFIITKTKLLT